MRAGKQSMEIRPFLVGGQWRRSAVSVDVLNPYTGKACARVSYAQEPDIEEAIQKATEAFKTTRRLPRYKRAEVCQKIASGIRERAEEFAQTISREAGKPILDARVEVTRAINTFQTASEEAKRVSGEILPLDLMPGSEGRIGLVRRFPIGPVLGISPFNFPLNLVAHKAAPAIACGNPILLKPPPQTPLTSLLLAQVILEADLPPEGISVLPCENRVAEKMVRDERVMMLSFTGSAPVGWHLKSLAGKKKVLLELGGNGAVIIHSDADIEYAAGRCRVGAFSYSGQVCISVQRIYVHDSLYDQFLGRFLPLVQQLVMGDPLDEKTENGPLISSSACARIEEWVQEALSAGAQLLIGGKRADPFFFPTVLTGVRPDLRISCEEVFGPVVVVEPYAHIAEAVARVNNSRYGLQAGIFTRDLTTAFYAYHEIQVGGVIVNDVPTYRIDQMPYGGIKESGQGREGVRFAIEEMTERKLCAINPGAL